MRGGTRMTHPMDGQTRRESNRINDTMNEGERKNLEKGEGEGRGQGS